MGVLRAHTQAQAGAERSQDYADCHTGALMRKGVRLLRLLKAFARRESTSARRSSSGLWLERRHESRLFEKRRNGNH